MLNFNQYITEALPLSTAKKYTKHFNRALYDKMFKGKYRIYLPLNKPAETKKEAPSEITSFLQSKGYKVDDYLNGIASKENSKNLYKIGRLLSSNPELKNKFDNDPARQYKKDGDYLVVISRHPYDIAGMTSGRSWSSQSCMRLGVGSDKDEGQYCQYVMNDVKEGTLVAYLIKNDDKNINDPVARLTIKPFENNDNKKEVILVPETKIYPQDFSDDIGFYDTVEKWVDKQNENAVTGYYVIKGNLYPDSIDKTVYKSSKLSNDENIKLLFPHLANKIKDKHLPGTELEDIIRKRLTNHKLPADFSDWTVDGRISMKFPPLFYLQGFPKHIKGDLEFSNSMIYSFEGAPLEVDGTLYISSLFSYNNSLKGLKQTKCTNFYSDGSNISSLKYMPLCKYSFTMKNSKLKNLKGLRPLTGNITSVILSENEITSLEDCPKNGISILDISYNKIWKVNTGVCEHLKELDLRGNPIQMIEKLPDVVELLDIEKKTYNALDEESKAIIAKSVKDIDFV